MARNPYVKVALADRVAANLMDATVVGQGNGYLLLERAAPKPRAAATARKRKRTAAAKAPASGTHTSMATATVANG